MADKVLSTDDELALAQLNALVKIPGALRIITNEVREELREDKKNRRSLPPLAAFHPEKGDPDLLKKPSTFYIHDVVQIVPHKHKEGQYEARSAEGDYTLGTPMGLLRRLQEWRTA